MITSQLNRIVALVVVSIITVCCSSKKSTVVCGNDPSLYPKVGTQSELLGFKLMGIMDTVTAFIEGNVVDIYDETALYFAEVHLTNSSMQFHAVTEHWENLSFHISNLELMNCL